jgi:hypothetical protein
VFTVKGSSSRLVLSAVKDLNKQSAGSENACSLIFHAPRGTAFADDAPPNLYHRSLGSVPLFMVPSGVKGSAQAFVAVINRLHG